MLDIKFAPVSNKEDWIETFQVSEEEDGSAIDITDAEITVSVRDPASRVQVLSAEVGDGVTLSDPTNGEFEIEFLAADMASLYGPQSYDVGITMVLASGTTTIALGQLKVLDGVTP